jgi:hypothetical protein
MGWFFCKLLRRLSGNQLQPRCPPPPDRNPGPTGAATVRAGDYLNLLQPAGSTLHTHPLVGLQAGGGCSHEDAGARRGGGQRRSRRRCAGCCGWNGRWPWPAGGWMTTAGRRSGWACASLMEPSRPAEGRSGRPVPLAGAAAAARSRGDGEITEQHAYQHPLSNLVHLLRDSDGSKT